MKLMVLDGNSIVNRAFYGIRMLNAPDGTPTNGVYGFLAILVKLLREEEPDAVCVSFDLATPTFRHKMYDGYKAQRKAMPEELAQQMPVLKQVLDAMGIRRYELEGFEADDIIGTIARIISDSGGECVIVTGDKDSFQLIDSAVSVLHVKTRMGKSETVRYDTARFEEEYGFTPEHMVDFKALMGDSSDNIPGVSGVGEKTALELMRKYGALDAIYADLESPDIKPGVRKKLAAGEESARLSYTLAEIDRAVPLEFTPGDCVRHSEYGAELFELFTRLGFGRFIEQWGLTSDGTTVAGDGSEDESEDEKMPRVAISDGNTETMLNRLRRVEYSAYIYIQGDTQGDEALEICDGEAIYTAEFDSEFSRRYFASDDCRKTGADTKDLMVTLLHAGIEPAGFADDISLAAYMLEPTVNGYELSRLALRYLGRMREGADAVFQLAPVLALELEAQGMLELYRTVELPLCRVLADMERIGVLVDSGALSAFGEMLSGNIAVLQDSIYEFANGEFNINSPKQLGELLFDRLMLPHGKKTKTGWSTNAEVLERLSELHPVVPLVLEYRKLSKLKSTYTDGLAKVISDDGRIHTNYRMTVTATGRLSSTEPNLQNIPVRTDLGSELRKMFVAAPGKMLVDADYSQIELRVLAHISGDETMIRAFLENEDIHRVTASQVFGLPPEEVDSLQRSRAKAVNFGIVYGISDFSLSQDIGVSRLEARQYIESYLEKYSGVREYMSRVVEDAKRDGHVATLMGRRRPLPEITVSNHNTRSFGERVARNAPIQGTAADIIKLAMVNVHRRFIEEGLEARLILQVHDELIAECPESETETVARLLREEMERAVTLSVPLTAEAHWGRSWYDAK